MAGDYLVAPRELPDGTVVWDDHAPTIAERIRDGDPTYGWTGDPRLSLCLNTAYSDERDRYWGVAWEIWRRHEDGSSSIVMRKKGAGLDAGVLLRLLAEHDTRYVDVIGAVGRANAELERGRDAAFHDVVEDRADRLAHALARDLDVAAPDGKVYPL